MTVIHAVLQTPFKSQRKLDTDIFNIARFTPGTTPPILPYLNICNRILDSSSNVYDTHTNARNLQDDWVFQGVVFYAHPDQEYHPDYANKLACKRNRWTMHLLERSPKTMKSRSISLEPTFNPQGQLYGFTMCLEPENATSPTTWAVKHFKADAIAYSPPNEQRSRDFYHCELVAYLNHRACQEDYMRVLPADRTGFFLNIVLLLVQLRVLDRSVLKPLAHTVDKMVWGNSQSASQPTELPTTVSPSMLFNRP
ncbi:hypothetical protein ACGC1H_005122 [Rhizoctonia solani]